jgi:hypothetical protein
MGRSRVETFQELVCLPVGTVLEVYLSSGWTGDDDIFQGIVVKKPIDALKADGTAAFGSCVVNAADQCVLFHASRQYHRHDLTQEAFCEFVFVVVDDSLALARILPELLEGLNAMQEIVADLIQKIEMQ